MGYLVRTNEDYRLFYGEPVNRFVITSNGSYFCADEYQKLVDEEKEVSAYIHMDSDNFPMEGWADVAENNRGIIITDLMAEYILDGKYLDVDQWVEIETLPSNSK